MSEVSRSIHIPPSVMMVRPCHFGYNPLTSSSNTFQKNSLARGEDQIRTEAIVEFDALVFKLRSKGIEVLVFDDDPRALTPDAVFPNNWIAFQPDGKIVIFPMMAENRRLERRQDIVDAIKERFAVENVIDLSKYEDQGEYLEGTGSIIFDHANNLAFANKSPRTSPRLFKMVCEELGYDPVLFKATDQKGIDIYHTNVLMSVGDSYCIICADSIESGDRSRVMGILKAHGHQILKITHEQLRRFAGNTIQLQNADGSKFQVMSESAYNCLDNHQRAFVRDYCEIIHSNLSTIESIGGGSARCMIAGIHLPPVIN